MVSLVYSYPPKHNSSCKLCGATFYASPGHKKVGWGIYCTMKCRNIAQLGSGNSRWSGAAGDRTCRHCGKGFRCKPSHIALGEGVYCSAACKKKHLSENCRCEHCGKDFSVYSCWKNKGGGKHCSRECASASVRTKVSFFCVVCGKVFSVKVCEIGRKQGTGSFCSRQCKGKHMSGSQLTSSGRDRNPRGGKREDIGFYVRSGWEANWCRYLKWLKDNGHIKEWLYEPDTFEFHAIKRGSRFYTPDFRITNNDFSVEYHEVKGWMDQKSRTKLKRMAKYYPEVKIIVIEKGHYDSVRKKISSIIPFWE